MPESSASTRPRARIAVSTHWTQLRLAAQAHTARPDARAAFQTFCERYRGAVYGVIRARNPEVLAQDLTQDFFLHHLLDCADLDRLDPERGRFRSWLYKSLKHFLIDEARRRTRQARDHRLERAFDEEHATAELSSVSEYERHYAYAVAERAIQALHAHWAAKLQRHGATVDKRMLMTWLIDRDSHLIAATLKITPDNARTTIERLHADLWKRLEAEVAETVADDASLQEELAEVCRILRLRPPADRDT
jgi:RNA polymerase sigma-70 factor (ECF subfamily)